MKKFTHYFDSYSVYYNYPLKKVFNFLFITLNDFELSGYDVKSFLIFFISGGNSWISRLRSCKKIEGNIIQLFRSIEIKNDRICSNEKRFNKNMRTFMARIFSISKNDSRINISTILQINLAIAINNLNKFFFILRKLLIDNNLITELYLNNFGEAFDNHFLLIFSKTSLPLELVAQSIIRRKLELWKHNLQKKLHYSLRKSNASKMGNLEGYYLDCINLTSKKLGLIRDKITSIATEHAILSEQFLNFHNWLHNSGPFQFIIDGANVAISSNSSTTNKFDFNRLCCVIKILSENFPRKRILIILHYRRLIKLSSNLSKSKEFLELLDVDRQIYCTPTGSDDDWYWMFATIKAKNHGYFISNDELVDHTYANPTIKYFETWKVGHAIRHKFSASCTILLNILKKYKVCIHSPIQNVWSYPSLFEETDLAQCDSQLITNNFSIEHRARKFLFIVF